MQLFSCWVCKLEVSGLSLEYQHMFWKLCLVCHYSATVWITSCNLLHWWIYYNAMNIDLCVFSVPSHMAIPSRMSPHTQSSTLGMDIKHPTSLPYTTSPYHLSPPAHSSPSPIDHHSTPSPRHDSSATSPSVPSLHSPMWLGTPREGKKPRESAASDQDGPLNLSKPRSDVPKRDAGDDRHGYPMHYNGSEKVTTPPPAHSNHRNNNNTSSSSSATNNNNHSGLSSPSMPTTPPKVSLSETPSPLFPRSPFLPPQYPFLGLAGHLPVSFAAAHPAYMMNGVKLPGMDTDKVRWFVHVKSIFSFSNT